MSVRFVLGPAGAGKTHLCVRELAAACDAEPLGPPLLFLLPQQATFIHEQRLRVLPGRDKQLYAAGLPRISRGRHAAFTIADRSREADADARLRASA